MTESILCWLLVEVLMWMSNKLKISKTYLSIGLCIVLWTWYYALSTYYPIELDKLIAFVWWSYASSQLIYNILKKTWVLDKLLKE